MAFRSIEEVTPAKDRRGVPLVFIACIKSGRDAPLPKIDCREECLWLLTQQLTHAMETGGVAATAKIIAGMYGANVDHAKALAYRLFTIAERKGRAQEAYAYNSLVISWPEVQMKAAELQSQNQQTTFFN